MRTFSSALGALILVLVALVVFIRFGALETDYNDAVAEYGAPPSKFIELDGTRIHYRDEGQGPVLVLLHGSRGNLQQWDGWVSELGNRFRMIRVDALAHGLAGADAHDDYSAARREVLFSALLDELQVDRFILIGTSSGATQAVRYAATHPERVEKLLLSTVPLRLPPTRQTRLTDKAIFWVHSRILGSNATDLFWGAFLRSVYGDPDKVTDELIRRYRVMNSLPDQERRFRARLATWRRDGGPERDFAAAGKVTAPTLIQWGGAGPVLPRELFCEITGAFTSTNAQIIQYPELGHMLILEDPARTAQDALKFIDTGSGGESCESS